MQNAWREHACAYVLTLCVVLLSCRRAHAEHLVLVTQLQVGAHFGACQWIDHGCVRPSCPWETDLERCTPAQQQLKVCVDVAETHHMRVSVAVSV